jgi:glycosyltransferase involved in cell wall biosynthesis
MSKTAVLIPCYNEELTVEKVVRDFRASLPDADIYVYDNNSTDKTAELAVKAGAIVRKESQQGKGNVVRSMFRDIEADVYVLVDGDDTYPADEVQKLIDPVLNEQADMVIGDRLSNGTYFKENKSAGHSFGNHLVKGLINSLFHAHINDIMTGYRVFSRRFVKCMPVMSNGFQIETEMTIFSLVYGMNIKELPINYRDRPEGSFSKINTLQDGARVLQTLFNLLKDYRPFFFFFIIALIFMIFGLIEGIPVITEFMATHYIYKIPSAILASGLFVIAFLLISIGIILDSVRNQTRILFEMHMNEFMRNEKKAKLLK